MKLTSESIEGLVERWKSGLLAVKQDLKLNESDVVKHKMELLRLLNQTNGLFQEADGLAAVAEKQNETLRAMRKAQVDFWPHL